MATMHVFGIVFLAWFSGWQGTERESLTADAIMASVAANQDRSEKLRNEYVYEQHIRVVSRKTNGKLMREEMADYRVVPTPEGTKKVIRLQKGRYWHKGQYVDFRGEPMPDSDSPDAGVVHGFREDLMTDTSKDGLERDLFPLTSEEQKKYEFRLKGEETLRGRIAYRIGFWPKDKQDKDWTGEALIDKAELQPMSVFTKLSHRMPLFVRITLGLELPGLGFSVRYARQEDGMWFPVSFGTECEFHALFFFKRNVSLSLENTAFEHTHVQTTIDTLETKK